MRRIKISFIAGLVLLLILSLSLNIGAKGCSETLKSDSSSGGSFATVAPTGLTATASSATLVSLAWSETASYERGFSIERKTGLAGTYGEIAILAPNVITYSDTNWLSPATTYYYRVRTIYITTGSDYSNEASATTTDTGWDLPFTLSVTAVSSTQINLTWSDNFSAEQGFRIERKTGAAGTYAEITTPAAGVTTYSDTTVVQNTQYYYRVRVYYTNTNGPYSQEGSATTSGTTSNFWTSMTTTGAPTGRTGHTAIWADGVGAIFWGGDGLTTGAVYSPTADTWTATSIGAGLPTARSNFSATWTGTRMVIWGGQLVTPIFDYTDADTLTDYYLATADTGSSYDPATNSWSVITTGNAPQDRCNHTAVWTGSRLIVWGGDRISMAVTVDGVVSTSKTQLNTGNIYDPATNSWGTIFYNLNSGTGAPGARAYHSAVWTGGVMLVWGGTAGVSGGMYSPTTDYWIPGSTATSNSPSSRFNHTTIWTGNNGDPWSNKMIVWGGTNGTEYFNSGGIYDPVANTWTTLPTTNAPSPRVYHSAVWTGNKMIIWGGGAGILEGAFNNGGIYDIATNAWMSTSTANVPTARTYHAAAWDPIAKRMVIWGGWDALSIFANGGVYNSD